ncbi:MAG: S-methyl-5-thioribose-1-phosphate isomerase [Acidobacteria bacterium]|nr:S-methyl-5-thioribose-1-phosphate isomerase [Acidobacteriota bacterium]MBK7597038.1 S-methyl-5-thioribose-1-phosphate isomerase [Acidobacteriota bacterium]MBK8313684.1 S-methyl-5-thioribose-1-phosphate isomerase [Acidobacteriota bacterium]
MMIKTLEWTEEGVMMIDQRLLPTEEVYPVFKNYLEVAFAIKEMVVRGAPAIGVAAAMGVALGVRDAAADTPEKLDGIFDHICEVLAATRPTAVNLFWGIERMRGLYQKLRSENKSLNEIRAALIDEAKLVHKEDIEANRSMGRFGADLIPDGATVLTHCNAGALATAGYGTALGVIRAAVEAGKKVAVYADETRPFLQGARLTAWELHKDQIPVTLITDNMAGHFMKLGKIDCVVVGADRIASNGDAANKIGTYSVAVLAKENNLPFYVAAPISTLDLNIETGEQIPIEERSELEVSHIKGIQLSPDGISIANPAFDVTPNRYISAIITEKGIARPPFKESLKKLAEG